MDKSALKLCLALAAGCLMFGQASWAQDAPASAVTVDEDEIEQLPPTRSITEALLVTAQKREQSIQEVPLAVSTLSGDQLSNAFIGGVTDLALIAPSVSFTQSTNALNSSVQIRGIGTAVFSSAVEPSVSFVVDGVVMSRQGQAFTDLIDIERVEVLRGPQSTLFGKNASAGVINIITKRPSDEFEFEAETVIAEDNEYEAKGSVSGPLSDVAGARLTAYYKDREGHIDNLFDGRDLNGSSSYGFRGQFEWDITDSINLLLIGDVRESYDDCCQYQPRDFSTAVFNTAVAPVVPSSGNRQVNVNAPVFNDTTSWGVSAELNADIAGDHTLTSITAYRAWDFVNNIDVDGVPTPALGITGIDLNSGRTQIKQFSEELRLTSPSGGEFEYIAGLYFYYLDLDRFFSRRVGACSPAIPANAGLSPGDPCVVPTFLSGFFNGTVENQNYAAFGDVTWNVLDNVDLVGGVRLIYDRLEFSTLRPAEPLEPGELLLGPAPLSTAGTIDDFAPAGRGGIQFYPADDVMTYVMYSRGYKGATVDVAFEPDDRTVEPETSNSVEIGVKSSWFDDLLTVNVAAFYTEYENFQAQTFNAADAEFILTNAGTVGTKGVEADFTTQPIEGLSLFGGVAYTDAEIKEFPNGQCFNPIAADPDCRLNGTKDLGGGELPNSPDWKVNLTGRYDWDLGLLPARAFVQGSYVWQSDVQFSLTQNPNTIQGSYGIFDASVGLADLDDQVQVSFFVKNLLDKDYASFIFQDAIITNAVNINHYIPKNAERFVGGSVRVRF